MKKFFALAALIFGLLAIAQPAVAQSGCSTIQYGVVLTAAQWNACFAAKQNVLGFTPFPASGGTFTGKITTVVPTTNGAGFNLPPGTSPLAPVNGDLWTTNSGIYAQINGATVGPLISGLPPFYQPTASITALAAYGAQSASIGYARVAAYHAGTTKGGGDFNWQAPCPGTTNTGTYIAAVGVSGGCWVRLGPANNPEAFGAYGDALSLGTCTVSSTSLSCTGYPFTTAADAGKKVICEFAGASNLVARADPLVATINSATTGTATLSVAATNPLSGTGFCAWGHDDTTPIGAVSALTPWPSTVTLLSPGYLMTNTFLVGNNLVSYAHNFSSVAQAAIFSGIPNHTAPCFLINPAEPAAPFGQPYLSVNITNISHYCMNSGSNGREIWGGQPITLTNDRIFDTWKNCEAAIPTQNSGGSQPFIQQVAEYNPFLGGCGLHAFYKFSNNSDPNGGFIDEFNVTNPFVAGVGYNGMNPGLIGQAVSGIANNGSGIVRVTMASTANYTSGHPVTVRGAGGTTEANGVSPGTKIDSTHVDLSYTVTGAVAGAGGACLLTISAATPVGLVTQVSSLPTYTVAGISGATGCNGTHPITVIPSNPLLVTGPQAIQVLVLGTTFGGAYTSGGAIGIPFVHAYTSGGYVAPSEQLGAIGYSLAAGSGNNNIMVRHNFYGPIEFDLDRAGVQALGGDTNPNAIFFADGTIAHPERAADASALAGAYQTWNWYSPTIEASGGGAFEGATWATETPRLQPYAMSAFSVTRTGQWTYQTINIGFLSTQNPAFNGAANHFQFGNSDIGPPVDMFGSNMSVGGPLAANGLTSNANAAVATGVTYGTTIISTAPLINVPGSTLTDLTAYLGNTHGMVEISGECAGGSGDFDDFVGWQYFGNSTDSTAQKNNTYASPPTRTYSIDGGTGYLAVTTSGATACTVRVNPFGGH